MIRYAPFARKIALRQHRRCPREDYGDFEGAAMEGLCQAAKSWDPGRSSDFSRYAEFRIRGAIGDWQRTTWAVDGLRYQRDKARREGLPPPTPRGSSIDGIIFHHQVEGHALPEELRQEERGYHDTETRLTLQALIERTDLTDRDRRIIRAYYFEDRTLADIGAELGVHESRICQVLGVAVRALKETAASVEAA